MVTADVFNETKDVHAHFKFVGMALGLVRVKSLHLGMIAELEQQIKETNEK